MENPQLLIENPEGIAEGFKFKAANAGVWVVHGVRRSNTGVKCKRRS